MIKYIIVSLIVFVLYPCLIVLTWSLHEKEDNDFNIEDSIIIKTFDE